MATAARPYQMVVWGASGFVGRLVCERLATEYPGQFRVALAGRSRAKLEAVRDEMRRYDAAFGDVGILVAEAEDRSAVDAMTQSTDVVISCAGPYRKYSSHVVASSATNGTHYLDLSAEIPWIRSNIERFHEQARETKAKIVHFCGYDSVPADLGTLLVVDAIRERYNTGCSSVEHYLLNSFGGISGGTAASAVDMNTGPGAEPAAMTDPFCLTPQYFRERSGEAFPGVAYSAEVEGWLVPTPFAQINVPVVQRSNALAKTPYGANFRYKEGLKASNYPAALAAKLSFSLVSASFQYAILRGLFAALTPSPGSGPSLDVQRKKGFWRFLVVGYPEGTDAAPVKVRLEDNRGDPGYWSTSKMLLECALALVLEKDKIDDVAACQGGVLTPALAFGRVPLDRLHRSGFVVEVLP